MDRTKDQGKTREQLIRELADLRRQVANLKASVVAHEQREEALRRTEAEWRSLVENAPAKITTLDRDGTILFVNSIAPDRTTEGVVGTSIYNYLSPDERDEIEQVLESVFQSGVAKQYETVVVKTDGTEVVFSNNVAPIKHKDQTIAAISIATDITELKQAEERIRASLREKEVMLREIHHRVRNNLAVISSLLDFQARYTQDEQAQAALHESKSRVHSTALVHTQLYRTPDLAQIDFAAYVQTLTENLFAAYQVVPGGATLQLDISDVPLEVDQAIPCGLIITELVANALKHAFPVNGKNEGAEEHEIRVVFHPTTEGEYELVVSDNGVGLPSSFEFPSRDTLGLFLISAYARGLKGTVEWHADEGTTCRILFASGNFSKLLQDND
jgi:PAS domain S-box-containing protein